MDEPNQDAQVLNMRAIIEDAIGEFFKAEQRRSEPAYKAELVDERKRREQLERRLGELEEENRRSRQMAEEADRNSQIRAELQRLGVQKVDLAFKAVREDVVRTDDGRVVGRAGGSEMPLGDYLQRFVGDNPELLPPRIAGGSGAQAGAKNVSPSPGVDLERIRPGMSAEEMERVRAEIARVASQANRGM
jgi:hypothetical protein